MKTISFDQLEKYIDELRNLLTGNVLMKVRRGQDLLVFDWAKVRNLGEQSGLCSVILDCDKKSPNIIYSDEYFSFKAEKDKPITLFLKAHAIGLKLKGIEIEKNLGRVVKIYLGDDNESNINVNERGTIKAEEKISEIVEIVIAVIPFHMNVEVKVINENRNKVVKSISLNKGGLVPKQKYNPFNNRSEAGTYNGDSETCSSDSDTGTCNKVKFQVAKELFFCWNKDRCKQSGTEDERTSKGVIATALNVDLLDDDEKRTSEDKILLQLRKQISKKEKALNILRLQVEERRHEIWRRAGEYIKNHIMIEPGISKTVSQDSHLEACFDRRKSWSWNIQNCFEQAKKIEKKMEGTKLRIEKLIEEIQILGQDILNIERDRNHFKKVNQEFSKENINLKIAEVEKSKNRNNFAFELKKTKKQKDGEYKLRAKKVLLGEQEENIVSGHDNSYANKDKNKKTSEIFAYIGLSAKDNLALLRKARPWDYWIHLRDQPSAHGLLFRNKSQNIPKEYFEKVSLALYKQTNPKKSNIGGSFFDVVVVECRYVRPIKGDRIGRVTYQNGIFFRFIAT